MITATRVHVLRLALLLLPLLVAGAFAAEPVPAQKGQAEAGRTFQDCADCPTMVVIPPGRFSMGRDDGAENEAPKHDVSISRPFAVAIHPVTGRQWKACARARICALDLADAWGDDFPATGIPAQQVKAFLSWLSKAARQPYRLLTEAEFEYIASDPVEPAYPWGGPRPSASCNDCGSAWDGKSPSPVGVFPANRFGVYDAVSNVGIVVADCYHDTFAGAPRDGSAWLNGPCVGRVVRGGTWAHLAHDLNRYRRSYIDSARYPEIGLRVARSVK